MSFAHASRAQTTQKDARVLATCAQLHRGARGGGALLGIHLIGAAHGVGDDAASRGGVQRL